MLRKESVTGSISKKILPPFPKLLFKGAFLGNGGGGGGSKSLFPQRPFRLSNFIVENGGGGRGRYDKLTAAGASVCRNWRGARCRLLGQGNL